jgi:hypothetical protein
MQRRCATFRWSTVAWSTVPVLWTVLWTVLWPCVAAAGALGHEATLLAGDASTNDLLGSAVAIAGDTAIVGAPNDDGAAGAAYVFVRTGSTWAAQQKLVATDTAGLQAFGNALALSGDTALVGARFDDNASGTDAGAAYVFVRSGGVWTQQQKLIGADTDAFDELGAAVALSGDTAVVGALRANDGSAGAVYVFVRSGGTWSQQQKLTASDAAGGDNFGLAVAIAGDTLIAGAARDDNANGSDAGAAYVFTRTAGTWSEQQKLLAGDGAESDRFGTSVAVSGETSLVGAFWDDTLAGSNAGSAYVFTRAGTAWSQQQKLQGADSAAGDQFGVAVSLASDTALVGADFDTTFGGALAGSAYVFVRTGGLWQQQQQLLAPDGTSGDGFGYALAIAGDSALCGARTNDTNSGTDAGSAYVFRASSKGDLNLDGRTDLLVRLEATGQNDAWLMDGITRPSAPVTLSPTPASVDWVISGVDDFDADHDNDLLMWNRVSGAAEFWLMNGTTRVGTPVALAGALAPPWRPSATADFDHDNRPDIVYRNSTTQKIQIWRMNGTSPVGTLVPTPDQAVDANWEIVGAQDWNGDGNTDFLWYNSNSGKIVLWFMDASVARLTGLFTTPANAGDNNWKVLAMGDYGLGPSGLPGTIDIVWRNATSGRFVVWYMDRAGGRTSGSFTSPDAPSPTPTDWTIVGPR